MQQSRTNGVAALWPPGAILLATLLRHQPATWPTFATLGGAADLAAGLASGTPLTTAVGFAAIDAVEALLAAAAMLRLAGPGPWFTATRTAALCGLICLLVPIVSSTAASGLLAFLDGAPFVGTWRTWYVSDALGLLTIVPFLLSWTDPALRPDRSWRLAVETAALTGVVLMVAAVIFGQQHLPLLFLAFPFLLLSTFRAGLPGATAGAIALACVGIGATLMGHGPVALIAEAGTTARIQFLQLYLAVILLSVLPVAVALAEREAARREAEAARAAVVAERARLDFALDAAGAGVWSWDRATDRASWSRQMFQLFGLDRAATAPSLTALLARMPPEDAARVQAAAYEAREPSFRYEFRLDHPTHGLRWIAAMGRNELGPDGTPVRRSGVNIDVTDRRLAEEAVRDGEERLRRIASNVPGFVFQLRIDAAGRWTVPFVNDKVEEFAGITAARLASDPALLFQNVLADDLATLHRAIAESGATLRPWSYEYRIEQDGRFRWLHGKSVPRREPDGGTLWDAVVVDVTSLKEIEAQLRGAKEAAEAATAKAEEAGRAKSEFLAAMSHEIRTPMTAVLGMTDLLAADLGLGGTQRRYVEAIRDSGRHLLSILNDVLDFSRIESGRLELERVDFSVGKVLEEVRSLMAVQAVERGLSLRFALAEHSPPVVIGDPTRLRQVLINLVGNGLKFTHRGGVTVTVGCSPPTNGGARFRFDVTDTGTGIAGPALEGLFEAFAQADRSTTRRYGGSGLGLAICRRLITAMGGLIWVESEPGRGSTFSFEVPFDLGDAVVVAERAEFDPSAVSPLDVLIAEDVEINRELLAAILGQHGHRLTFAANGAEALALADAPFDVILMDVQMPVMDGVEATRRIRRLDPPAGLVPIIALTASVLSSERDRCLEAGMSRVVTKPVDWPELFAAMGDLTRGPSAGGAGRSNEADPEPPDALAATPLIDRAVLADLADAMSPKALADLMLKVAAGSEAASRDLAGLDGLPEEVRRLAHQTRGTAASFGMVRVVALAGAVEDALERGVPTSGLLVRLQAAAGATRAEVEQSVVGD